MIMRIVCIAVLIVIFSAAPLHAQSRPEDIPSDFFASLNGYTGAEISPNGETLAYLYPIDGRQNLVIEDLETEARQVIPPNRLGQSHMVFKDAKGDWLTLNDTDWYQNGWRPRAFTADNDIIIVVGYGEHDTAEARTLNTSTGEFVNTLFSNPDYDLDVVLRHPYSRERMGVSHTDHRSRIDYFDESFAKLQSSLDRAIPDSRNYIRSFSKDMRKLVVHSSNSREPGMLLLWDRDAKTMDPIGWFNENLDPDILADVKAVEYESADGTIIPAYLTLPAGADAGALPAIVLPHGGPASRTDTSYWFLTQFLVSRGYAVLQANFRGSDGYGWEFRHAGHATSGLKEIVRARYRHIIR